MRRQPCSRNRARVTLPLLRRRSRCASVAVRGDEVAAEPGRPDQTSSACAGGWSVRDRWRERCSVIRPSDPHFVCGGQVRWTGILRSSRSETRPDCRSREVELIAAAWVLRITERQGHPVARISSTVPASRSSSLINDRLDMASDDSRSALVPICGRCETQSLVQEAIGTRRAERQLGEHRSGSSAGVLPTTLRTIGARERRF
jgi:hypothetical protein